MIRQLLNLLTALSLLLLAVLAATWVRSHFRHDLVRLHLAGGDRCSVISSRGTLLFEHHLNEVYYGGKVPAGWEIRSAPASTDFRTARWENPAVEHRVFGYGVVVNRGTVGPTQQSARRGAWRNFALIIPYWPLVLTAAVLPAVALLRIRRARARGRVGRCTACGYDLTGNVSGVCPECGVLLGQGGPRGTKNDPAP